MWRLGVTVGNYVPIATHFGLSTFYYSSWVGGAILRYWLTVTAVSSAVILAVMCVAADVPAVPETPSTTQEMFAGHRRLGCIKRENGQRGRICGIAPPQNSSVDALWVQQSLKMLPEIPEPLNNPIPLYARARLPSDACSIVAGDTMYIFSPAALASWYYQFRDSLCVSLKQLGIRVMMVSSPTDLKRARPQDIVLILTSPHHEYSQDAKAVVLNRQLRAIVFETEPVDVQRPQPFQSELWRDITTWQPQLCSVWSYNFANVASIKRAIGDQVRVSLISPGYSSVVDYRTHPDRGATVANEVAAVVYAGASTRLSGLEVINHQHVFSHSTFAKEVATHHVAVNVHKNPRGNNLEMFRLAPMLSSGMRVISEHSGPEDELSLKGLVTFTERGNINTLARHFLREAENETLRKIVASEISAKFSARFNLTHALFEEFLEWNKKNRNETAMAIHHDEDADDSIAVSLATATTQAVASTTPTAAPLLLSLLPLDGDSSERATATAPAYIPAAAAGSAPPHHRDRKRAARATTVPGTMGTGKKKGRAGIEKRRPGEQRKRAAPIPAAATRPSPVAMSSVAADKQSSANAALALFPEPGRETWPETAASEAVQAAPVDTNGKVARLEAALRMAQEESSAAKFRATVAERQAIDAATAADATVAEARADADEAVAAQAKKLAAVSLLVKALEERARAAEGS